MALGSLLGELRSLDPTRRFETCPSLRTLQHLAQGVSGPRLPLQGQDAVAVQAAHDLARRDTLISEFSNLSVGASREADIEHRRGHAVGPFDRHSGRLRRPLLDPHRMDHRAQQFLTVLVGGRRGVPDRADVGAEGHELLQRCFVEDDAFSDVALEQSFEALHVVLGHFPFLFECSSNEPVVGINAEEPVSYVGLVCAGTVEADLPAMLLRTARRRVPSLPAKTTATASSELGALASPNILPAS